MTTTRVKNGLSLLERAEAHGRRLAIRSPEGAFSYRDLLEQTGVISGRLLSGLEDLEETRVAFLCPPGQQYVSAQWGIWQAGGVAVPLSRHATEPELEHTLRDASVQIVVTAGDSEDRLRPLCERLDISLIAGKAKLAGSAPAQWPEIAGSRRAMILYTSGTTSHPKGVVFTHDMIEAQIESLVQAWQWQADDSIPLFLPLHHVHGIINVLSCALWTGALVEPFASFDIDSILDRVAEGRYTLFMAVPTIYLKLIGRMESLNRQQRLPFVEGFSNMRLIVSGSAALPASVHEKWNALTGQCLLERYGMTESGMILSSPYDGERRPGTVGQPLPGIQVRLKSESGEIVTVEDEPGEIQVRGNAVFQEYWDQPEVTARCFDAGWFQTGDLAVMEDGYYRLLGRRSVDIIKSGGYKLSALEIESVLLDHPAIRECCVVGIPDELWGETVGVAVALKEDCTLDLSQLRSWGRTRLSSYKLPSHLRVVDTLPRNAMGKVNKPAVSDGFA